MKPSASSSENILRESSNVVNHLADALDETICPLLDNIELSTPPVQPLAPTFQHSSSIVENAVNNILEPQKNAYVDKITMELLLNKNHYSKYLSKTDPAKYDEYCEFKNKLQKYSDDIIDMTSQLIENPKMTINNDISENFDIYIKSVLRYLEMREIEQRDEYVKDDDMMFPPNAMEQRPLLVKKHGSNNENHDDVGHSFWGKHRVKKMSSYDLSMFSRNFPK